MAGRHINDHQVRLFMTHRRNDPVALAAAKAGFSPATGYRVLQDARLRSQRQAPRGRRRPDPLSGIFEEVVVPMLEAAPVFVLSRSSRNCAAGTRIPSSAHDEPWRGVFATGAL